MKVSLNWIQEYSNFDLNKIKKTELFDKIGSQLGAIDDVIEWGPKYKGVKVVKVVSCEKHPNADKLTICKIDDGKTTKGLRRDDAGFIELVCGAPNVRKDMLAAWIPPGEAVPETYDVEPFVIESREIRGVVSNGMLASPKELGISNEHRGILDIGYDGVDKEKVKPGTPIVDLYGLDDTVVDIENKMFTHRPDCFGLIGVAREIAGIFGKKFRSPSWYLETQTPIVSSKEKIKLKTQNLIQDLVPRFTGQVLTNISISPSPIHLQAGLTRIGIRPVNNIVDLTNYIMAITGQPVHAFDYDKVLALSNSPTIMPRLGKKGEKLKLLSGKTIELTDKDIVIATDKKPIALAGIMGGAETEVSDSTKRVILECASFDMYTIRRSTMRHGLFTEASTRFTKGQSPLQQDRVLHRLVYKLCEYGAQPTSTHFDIIHPSIKRKPKPITIESKYINDRLGLSLQPKEIKKRLKNVELSIDLIGDNLKIRPSFWRTDLHIREDIVEEVGRLYGYDKLPLKLPIRDLSSPKQNENIGLKKQLRELMAEAGANEVLTYSFVPESLLEAVNQEPKHAFKIANALSPELQFYRLSLIPSLLKLVHPNIKSGFKELAIYEIGKSHMKGLFEPKSKIPASEERIAIVYAAHPKARSHKKHGAPYFIAQQYLGWILGKLGIDYELHVVDHSPSKEEGRQAIAPFDHKRTAYVRAKDTKGASELIGFIGEFHDHAKSKLKLPEYCAGFELDVSRLMKFQKKLASYSPLSEYPPVSQDITLKVPSSISYNDLTTRFESSLQKTFTDELGKIELNWGLLSIYRPEKSKSKNYTFRISVASYSETLNDKQINALLNKVANKSIIDLGGQRV